MPPLYPEEKTLAPFDPNEPAAQPQQTLLGSLNPSSGGGGGNWSDLYSKGLNSNLGKTAVNAGLSAAGVGDDWQNVINAGLNSNLGKGLIDRGMGALGVNPSDISKNKYVDFAGQVAGSDIGQALINKGTTALTDWLTPKSAPAPRGDLSKMPTEVLNDVINRAKSPSGGPLTEAQKADLYQLFGREYPGKPLPFEPQQFRRAPTQPQYYEPQQYRQAPTQAQSYEPQQFRRAPTQPQYYEPQQYRQAPTQAQSYEPQQYRQAPTQAQSYEPQQYRQAPTQDEIPRLKPKRYAQDV